LITYEKIKESDNLRFIISQTDKEIEDKSFAYHDMGGYYSFYKNGIMKSYFFFTKSDTIYNKKDTSIKVLDVDTTKSVYSFCSYAELYDTTGELKKVYGNPLVYKEIELLKNGRACVTLHFYSFNKFYDYINIRTNTGNTFQLTVTKDNSYSNMMKTSFSYNFRGVHDIKIYIQTDFLDCNNKRQDLQDSILVNSTVTTQ